MAVEVRMPQMGESIAEGTVVRWFKEIGDRIERDELLFEITTDKVDTEVPSPAAGWLAEILVLEGETVPVETPLCRLSPEPAATTSPSPAGDGPPISEAAPRSAGTAVAAPANAPPVTDTGRSAGDDTAIPERVERLRTHSSPLVRRLAAEHAIDLSHLVGTGTGGRVTKDDIARHLAVRAEAGVIRTEELSPIRKSIAEHMLASQRTSAHVTSVFQVDMSNVRRIKSERSAGRGRSGVR